MSDIIRTGDLITFTCEGARPVRLTYSTDACPMLATCETCGAMVASSHCELHATFHGWHRD